MNINEIIQGFRIDEIRQVEEIKAVFYEMTHIRTDAKLIWCKREDDNKTFSIAFKTIPTDSTGVFHILEHSVLNGSEKFPLKEPFVDLLKGSLQTFLNAMTFPDKTIYPVSSRNDQDFINLIRVYMDGVFNPMVKKNPFIFKQEGWHYELNDKDEPITLKGVVYNEMKGAYSSAEELAQRYLNERLFPDTTYSFSSGGNPDCIPNLTYEAFCKAHDKYYNPTNALIWLDGNMDIDKVLNTIDGEFLSNYGINEERIAIEYQKPVKQDMYVAKYPVADNDTSDKAIINFGYVYGSYDDYEKTLALNIIGAILTESNQSPLKKAIIENGLGQDMYAGVVDGTLQPHFEIAIFNSNEEKYEKIKDIISKVIKEEISKGFDKEELTAYLNKFEFSSKERDFGSAPKGLVFGIQAYSSWLYGGDPVDGIVVDQIFGDLREKINTSYFEDLLQSCILDSQHYASVVMIPDANLEAENARKLKEELAAYKATLSEEEIEELLQFNKEFVEWQNMEDSDEIKSMLPKLNLTDVDEKPSVIDYKVEKINNIDTIMYSTNTEGINYYNLFFNVDDLSVEELQNTVLMSKLLGELDTVNYDVLTFNRKRKSVLGSLSISIQCFSKRKVETCQSYVCVSYSCLDKNREEALQLVKELLYNVKFDNLEAMSDVFKQAKYELEMGIVQAGHQFGIQRVMGSLSEMGATKEYTSGYEFYKALKNVTENFDQNKANELKVCYDKLFTTNRLTLSLMGESKEEMAEKIISCLKQSKEPIVKKSKPLLEKKKEGIVVASTVAYAETGSNQFEKLKDISGKVMVISKILSLDYLWSNVRAKGGAYGCGSANRGGCLVFYSYRDPSPENSINIYNSSENYLKNLCETDFDLTTYIIGTVGDNDPLLTNSTIMNMGNASYFSDISYEDRCDIRKQILTLTKEDIVEIADIYKKSVDSQAVCVVGGKELIEKLDLDVIHEL